MTSPPRREDRESPESVPSSFRGSFWGDLLVAGATATLVGGVPSTLHALFAGRDVTEAARAAGTILFAAESSPDRLVLAGGLVHCAVSFFWAAILTALLPRRRAAGWAAAAGAAIGVFDLEVLGPLFPEIDALSFWPQMADHLAWGASLGLVLGHRARMRRAKLDR